MSYYVYIISTKRNNKKITYTGYSKDVDKRILLHNSGKGARFTKGSYWKLSTFSTVM
jgi:putative endonuclease